MAFIPSLGSPATDRSIRDISRDGQTYDVQVHWDRGERFDLAIADPTSLWRWPRDGTWLYVGFTGQHE